MDFARKTIESIRCLIRGTPGNSGGMTYSLLHEILIEGPKRFRTFPTALSIGRALFLPLIFLFRNHKK